QVYSFRRADAPAEFGGLDRPARLAWSPPQPLPSQADAADGEQDLPPRAEHAADGARDLGAAAPPPVAHRHLDHGEAGPRGARLHLHRPAVVAVAHAERLERLPADGAERSQVRGPQSE